MADDTTARHCPCGTRLARDNPGPLCSSCQAARRRGPVSSRTGSPRTREGTPRPTVGDAIARRRHELGLTQEVLAGLAGVSAETIKKLEQNGRTSARIATLDLIARALHTSTSALLSGDHTDRPVDSAAAPGHHASREQPRTKLPSATGHAAPAINERAAAPVNASRIDVPGDMSHALKRREFLAAGGAAVVDTALTVSSRTAQALEIVASDDSDSLDATAESLNDLVTHYSERLATSPPAELYGDLLNVRAYTTTLLRGTRTPTRRADMLVAAGWLSNLLAVATSYLGDHGAAIVWCGDAERRSQQSGLLEIAGWASLTRATIAYYQGQANRSATLSSRGQGLVPIGTVVHAKLAAQEMRARAMSGDVDGMLNAKSRAMTAISRIRSQVPTGGVFSMAMSREDPPYTATSLLLVNRFQEAATATRTLIGDAYSSVARHGNEPSSNYARALLILALAEAGLGHVSDAVAAGRSALSSAGLVWPTLVLAGKLDRVLMRDHANSAGATEFHTLYLDALSRTANSHIPPAVSAPR